ncbi:hypothetical protein [Staphylococcus petrasii]|nr:hypothetical protein [Staphylococcus petrasii]
MRMINSRLIFFIQVGYGLIYLTLAIVGSHVYGLSGFCWATIIAMLVKLIATNLLVVKITTSKKGKNTIGT